MRNWIGNESTYQETRQEDLNQCAKKIQSSISEDEEMNQSEVNMRMGCQNISDGVNKNKQYSLLQEPSFNTLPTHF